MSKRKGEQRHELIEDRLRSLEEVGAIEEWRYERAAQRYIVDLGEEIELQGGVTETNMLVMTLMSVEAFLAGIIVARREGLSGRGHVFVVDEEGVTDVQ